MNFNKDNIFKVGDRVFSYSMQKWGTVITTPLKHKDSIYSVTVEFDVPPISEDDGWFLEDGRRFKEDVMPDLFHEEVQIIKATKEQQMSIEVGSKWVKKDHCVRDELEVVEVCDKHRILIRKSRDDNDYYELVFLIDRHGDVHALTESDFLDQYKPYEPVYEYRYVYKNKNDSYVFITMSCYKDDEEFLNSLPKDELEDIEFQHLDLTKKERKA